MCGGIGFQDDSTKVHITNSVIIWCGLFFFYNPSALIVITSVSFYLIIILQGIFLHTLFQKWVFMMKGICHFDLGNATFCLLRK
jgi:hypothetical protein